MKVGFIGGGNMASAILSGMVQSGNFSPEDLFVYDHNAEKMQKLHEELGIQTAPSIEALVKTVYTVVIAVKPKALKEVILSIARCYWTKEKLFISIAAGKSIKYIEDILLEKRAIARVMPNINATVLESMTAYCFNSHVLPTQKAVVQKICESFGKAIELPEEDFPLFGVIAGSAPAFTYMYIDEVARAAVAHGMKKETALEIAAQMVLGSAKHVASSKQHPYALVDSVCSPGGTTIEGVKSLAQDNFAASIHNAIDKTLEKDAKL